MQYITNCAVSIKGDRVVKGTVVELEPEFAASLGSDVSRVDPPAEEIEPEEEKALKDMTAAELKAKAEELGLAASGTKADLLERITLHLEGNDEEEEDEVDN